MGHVTEDRRPGNSVWIWITAGSHMRANVVLRHAFSIAVHAAEGIVRLIAARQGLTR
jgi:hypothetical protein